MLGDISDQEANELIALISKGVVENILKRGMVESKIFPVSHYIGVACYILYDRLRKSPEDRNPWAHI